MTFRNLIHRAQKSASDNAPTLLTAVGVVGTVTTAVLTGKATYKATLVLLDDEIERAKTDAAPIEPKEIVKMVWPVYIPAVAVGTTTIGCILMSNRIGTRRAAAMAAAYSLSEKTFSEYRDKVVERLGAKDEQAVRDELAQQRADANPASEAKIYVTDTNEALFLEALSGRYFRSSVEKIRKAQNDINHEIVGGFYAPLSKFYSKIGLPNTSISDELGWNATDLLEVQFSAIITDDGQPAIEIMYEVDPIRDYWRFH